MLIVPPGAPHPPPQQISAVPPQPLLIRTRGAEVSLQPVGRDRFLMIRVGGRDETTLGPAEQAQFGHHAANRFAATGNLVVVHQVPMHPPVAIRSMRVAMRLVSGLAELPTPTRH